MANKRHIFTKRRRTEAAVKGLGRGSAEEEEAIRRWSRPKPPSRLEPLGRTQSSHNHFHRRTKQTQPPSLCSTTISTAAPTRPWRASPWFLSDRGFPSRRTDETPFSSLFPEVPKFFSVARLEEKEERERESRWGEREGYGEEREIRENFRVLFFFFKFN